MIGCQKCGITEDGTDGGLRILPYWANEPDSRWDWLALCRACFEDETAKRAQDTGRRLATPTWGEASRPTHWERSMLEVGRCAGK